MAWPLDGWGFLTVLVLVFSLFMLLAGIFTAYFGSGKSRMIGVVLLVIGIVVGAIWVVLGGLMTTIPVDMSDIVFGAFLYIIAAVIGALVAIGVFLLAIMKS